MNCEIKFLAISVEYSILLGDTLSAFCIGYEEQGNRGGCAINDD